MPKVEVFGGYSWYHPGGTVGTSEVIVTSPDVVHSAATSGSSDVPDIPGGWGAQITYNLNHWLGLAVDGSGHYKDSGSVYTAAGGPQVRLRRGHFTPFGEVLFGVAKISPNGAPDDTQFALLAGGGLDYRITPRFSIRPIQADYVYTHYDAFSSSNVFNGVRLQAGVVFNFGLPKEESAVSASCSAEPSAVDAGAPVQIQVTPSGFLPKRVLSYSYTGGKVAGNGASATVDTTGQEAGSYTVTAHVADNGKGKHQRTASCQATYMVNAKHPPTLSISASPDSLCTGASSTITASGSSPDNRPLTYTCTSTAGQLSGSGPSYTLDTTGVAESTVNVSCTVTDDRNLSATSSSSVKVNACAPPPAVVPAAVPQANKFGDIEFKNDPKRPTRVDNEAKGELDRYADALAAAPDSKGVVVGFATAEEDQPKKGSKTQPQFAALRAVNTKEYLTKEKGVDPVRIEPRTGSGDDQRTDLWIVPAGATFPAEGTSVVNEGAVKAIPRTALKEKAAPGKMGHKKMAHKKAAKAD